MTATFGQRFGRLRLPFCFALVFTGVALGGRTGAEDAESLIRQGIEHRRADRNVEALKLFQQAYDLQKSPRALAQMGTAEQALGRWGAADRHLGQAVKSVDDPWIRKNRATLDEALRAISAHVGRLDVTGTPAGAEVRVDGDVIGHLPFSAPISVTAGGVAIEVRAPEHLPIVRAATVPVGTLVRETFNLQSVSPVLEPARTVAGPSGSVAPSTSTDANRGAPASRLTPARPASGAETSGTGSDASSVGSLEGARGTSNSADGAPENSADAGDGSVRRAITLGVAGLAVAALGFGIIEHVTWQKKVSSFGNRADCDGSLAMRGGPGCQGLYNDGESAKKLAFVGYGVGVGLAATAAILFFTRPQPSAGGSESAKLACAPTPFEPGFGCAFRF